MRNSSKKANPVHRCTALQLRPRHGSPTKRERAAVNRSPYMRAFSSVSGSVSRITNSANSFPLLSLSLSLALSLSLSSNFSSLSLSLFPRLSPPDPFIHTYIRSGLFSLSLFLSSLFRTLKLVSVSHGLSVVPSLLVHALLIAGSNSLKIKTWIYIFFLICIFFLII